MIYYAVAWHPHSDNLGDDLRTLAASQLLPHLDRVLDAEHLDAPLSLEPQDRLVTLLSGAFLRHPFRWLPHPQVAPVFAGVHFSAEDAWGVPFESLDGVGRELLLSGGPLPCRDERTLRLMQKIDQPAALTGCITLTLQRPEVTAEAPYICCVDVPEKVTSALREFAPGVNTQVRVSTHQLTNPSTDFETRMAGARAVVAEYAGASFVVTRRLHCALACLAVGTPVVLLYNSGYEDVSRFAPLDTLVRTQPVEEFLAEVYRNGFPMPWSNPAGMEKYRNAVLQSVHDGMARAKGMSLPVIDPEQAAQWRAEHIELTITRSAEKIRRLELELYEGLHEKFSLLMKEDSAKASLTALIKEPEMIRALRRLAWRRVLEKQPWYKRPLVLWKLWRGQMSAENLLQDTHDVLRTLGWPEKER